jgi:hypothetical protein
MAKRSKKPADLNRLAAAVVDEAIGEGSDPNADKDLAAVSRGRKGGKKGGQARAARMTPEERSEASRIAARARWKQPS